MTTVSITLAPAWHAFAVAVREPSDMATGGWTVSPIDAGWQIELAGAGLRDWETLAPHLISGCHADVSASAPYVLSQSDAVAGTHAFAAFVDDRLIGALIVQPSAPIIGRDWLVARLGTALGPSERFRLLAGRPGGVLSPRGPTVCFCCDVGRNDIVDAVRAGCSNLAMVSEKTRAGMNCGVCRPNVSRVIDEALAVGAR